MSGFLLLTLYLIETARDEDVLKIEHVFYCELSYELILPFFLYCIVCILELLKMIDSITPFNALEPNKIENFVAHPHVDL